VRKLQSRNLRNSKGIDISHYQTISNWNAVKDSGISFVIIKSTEGSGVIDSSFQSHLNGAKSVGMKVGVYHFCRAKDIQSAIQEADFFISVINSVGGFGVLDIAPALDIETPEGASRDNVVAICRAWVERVKQASGMQPLLYSFPSFADQYLDASLADIPLWYAYYNADQPSDKAGWSQWTFMQYSEKGHVPGIDGFVDLDEYSGDIDNYNGHLEDEFDMDKILDYPDWAWVELDKYVGDAYNESIVSDWYWVQRVRDKQLQYKELLLLKVLIDERRRNKALGIQQ
jgi:lysozyme